MKRSPEILTILPALPAKAAAAKPDRPVHLDRPPNWITPRNPFYAKETGKRLILKGLERRLEGARRFGWQQLADGFAVQRPDGSVSQPKGSVLGTAFLMKAAATSLILEKEMTGRSAGDALVPDLHRAAKWICSLDWKKSADIRNYFTYNHRFWVTAAGLQAVAQVTGDQAISACAERFAMAAIKAQRANGVNPERNGYDVGYQSTGLVGNAEYILLTNSGPMRTKATRTLKAGLTWLEGRVSRDGSIDVGRSTRILHDPARNGRPKPVPYVTIASAFAWGAGVLDRPSYRQIALRIASTKHYKRSKD